jgi:hypothetical protein
MSGEKMTEGKKMTAETKLTEETKLFEEKKAAVSVFWVRPHTRGCPSRCF